MRPRRSELVISYESNSLPELGLLLGVSTSTVFRWMKEEGIPTRRVGAPRSIKNLFELRTTGRFLLPANYLPLFLWKTTTWLHAIRTTRFAWVERSMPVRISTRLTASAAQNVCISLCGNARVRQAILTTRTAMVLTTGVVILGLGLTI